MKNLRSEKGYKLIIDTEKNLLNNIRIWCMNNKDEMKYYFEEQLIDNINRDIWPENMILRVAYYYKGIKHYIDEKTILEQALPDLKNIELGIECNGYIPGEEYEIKLDDKPALQLHDMGGMGEEQFIDFSEVFEESLGNFFCDNMDFFPEQEMYHTVESDYQRGNPMSDGGENDVLSDEQRHKDTYSDCSGKEYSQNTPITASIPVKKYILLAIIGLFVMTVAITVILLTKNISSNYEKSLELTDNTELTEPDINVSIISNKENNQETEIFEDIKPKMEIEDEEKIENSWSDWVEKIPEYITEADYEIKQKIQYSSRSRDTIESEKDNISGWTLYDKYAIEIEGEWSDWSEEEIVLNENIDVKEKTVYKYRELEKTESESPSLAGWTNVGSREEWGDYGEWSDWSFDAVANSDTRQVRTRKVSSYYYFYCNKCGRGARYPFHGYNCEICGTKSVYLESGTVEWFETPWSNSISWGSGKYYQYIDGGIWWNYADGIGEDGKTQYQYKDLKKKVIYYYERPGEWSEWSDEVIEDTETREVKTKTMYRYKENETKIIYVHEKLGEWSEYVDTEITASEGREVQTRLVYSYKKR